MHYPRCAGCCYHEVNSKTEAPRPCEHRTDKAELRLTFMQPNFCALCASARIKNQKGEARMSVLAQKHHPKVPGYFTVATIFSTLVVFALLILKNCARVLTGW